MANRVSFLLGYLLSFFLMTFFLMTGPSGGGGVGQALFGMPLVRRGWGFVAGVCWGVFFRFWWCLAWGGQGRGGGGGLVRLLVGCPLSGVSEVMSRLGWGLGEVG